MRIKPIAKYRLHHCVIALSLGVNLSASAETGHAVPGLEALDAAMTTVMRQYGVPGAALGVTQNGRLVFARGYGLADRGAGIPVQPTTPFRVASLSKPITSAAVMKLVENGQLALEAKIVPLLGLHPAADLRWNDITVRNLLEHSGGWDRTLPGAIDPVNAPLQVAHAMGTASPPSIDTIIAYMTQRPLDFAPGTAYAYSPFGYLLLGRVIERVTGVTYGSYLQTLLAPSGVQDMFLGRSHSKDLQPNESHYYDYPGAPLVSSVFSDAPGLVPAPDGGLAMEDRDAPGGWVVSTIDYLRFLTFIDPQTPGPHLLAAATVGEMLRRPDIPEWQGKGSWYAKGWSVQPNAAGMTFWHTGGFAGTSSYVLRYSNGISYVALFNSLDAAGDIYGDISTRLGAAISSISASKAWPSGDQFPDYSSPINYQGLWWATPAGSESGWGINFAHQSDAIFATWYTYDSGGKAWWLSMLATRTAGDTFSGPIYVDTGPSFDHFVGSANAMSVGSGTLNFSNANNGTFHYDLNAATGGSPVPVSQTKTIARYDLGTGPQVSCTFDRAANLALATNYQDLWWAANGIESGWGINFAHQGNSLYATWYAYDPTGAPLWLSALTKRVGTTNVYSGPLLRTSGPRFDSYKASDVVQPIPVVGTATLTIADGNSATFNYITNGNGGLPAGVNQTKSIVRYPFAASGGTVCH